MSKTIRATDNADRRARKADKRRRAVIRAQKLYGWYVSPDGTAYLYSETGTAALIEGATDGAYTRRVTGRAESE